jgi:hypothetical protein
MFNKIESENPETEPKMNQYIAFKLGDVVFAGFYLGEKKASPFSANNEKAPIVLIEEWIPIRIWT